jgi:hypothetical protein
MLVVHGVTAAAMLTIDANRSRTYADVLKIREFANHSYLAGLTARVWHWWHGNYGTQNTPRVQNPTHLGSAPSHAQRNFWWERVEEVYEVSLPLATTFGLTAARKMALADRAGISPGTYSLAYVVLSAIDPYSREQFFDELIDGTENPNSGNPIVALHNRLKRLKPRERFDNVDQLNAVFLTYNHWVRGTPLTTLNDLRLVRYNTVAIPHGWVEMDEYMQNKAEQAAELSA